MGRVLGVSWGRLWADVGAVPGRARGAGRLSEGRGVAWTGLERDLVVGPLGPPTRQQRWRVVQNGTFEQACLPYFSFLTDSIDSLD